MLIVFAAMFFLVVAFGYEAVRSVRQIAAEQAIWIDARTTHIVWDEYDKPGEVAICKWCEEAPAHRTWWDEHNGGCAVCADCDAEPDTRFAHSPDELYRDLWTPDWDDDDPFAPKATVFDQEAP